MSFPRQVWTCPTGEETDIVACVPLGETSLAVGRHAPVARRRKSGLLVAVNGCVAALSSTYSAYFQDDLHHLVMQRESVPFLLVRPPSGVEDVLDDAETIEVPASRSVPPHHPPAPLTTNETDLPSVIVDLHELVSAQVEADRASDVDCLLAQFLDGEPVELPPPAVELNPPSHTLVVAA
jgi:hypothetical protein